MATIRNTIDLDAPAETVWDVVRDVGAVHTRFAPGFVTSTELIEGARIVTFANGLVAKEVFVGLDETLRRFAYSVRIERLSHHNASFEVIPIDAHRCRLVWTADVLPDSAAATIGPMMEQGSAVIRRTLTRKSA